MGAGRGTTRRHDGQGAAARKWRSASSRPTVHPLDERGKHDPLVELDAGAGVMPAVAADVADFDEPLGNAVG